MINRNIIIFIPSIEGYGVEKNLFIISNYLTKKFKSVKIVTLSNKYKKQFNSKINFISFKNPFFNKGGRLIKYFFSIFLLIKIIFQTQKPIIFSFQSNVLAILISKLFNKKIVIRLNSSIYDQKKYIFNKFISFFYNLSDKVIVNSIGFKREVKKILNVNAIQIYNPLNIKDIKIKSKKKITLFKKNNYLKIINIGRLVEQKNQILLIKALNIIKEKYKIKFQLIIIGEGNLKTDLLNYVKKKQLRKEIQILKFRKNPFPFIRSSDIFILTSIFEGLPNVLLEAKVLKKFIISSDCKTGPNEIIKNGETGLLFKNNCLDDLISKLMKYIKNKKKYDKKAKFKNRNLDKFSISKNLNLYFKVLKNV